MPTSTHQPLRRSARTPKPKTFSDENEKFHTTHVDVVKIRKGKTDDVCDKGSNKTSDASKDDEPTKITDSQAIVPLRKGKRDDLRDKGANKTSYGAKR